MNENDFQPGCIGPCSRSTPGVKIRPNWDEYSPQDFKRVEVAALNKNGYKFSHVPRPSKGGGVGLLYNSSLRLVTTKPIHSSEFEATKFVLKTPTQRTIHIYVLYRPPSSPKALFLEPFGSILREASVHTNDVLIVGDFNYHINDVNCKDARNLIDLINTNGFTQHVTGRTHQCGNTLDLVITPESSKLLLSQPKTTVKFGDHYIVQSTLNLQKPRPAQKQFSYRKYCNIDSASFSCNIREQTASIDNAGELHKTLTNIIDKHAPLVSRVITDRKHEEWHNSNVALAKRKLRRAERQGDEAYDSESKNFTKLLCTTKREFYSNAVVKAEKDHGKLYKITNNLLGRTNEKQLPSCADDSELAKQFQTFFTTKIENIHTNIVIPCDYKHLDTEQLSTVTLCKFPILSKSDVLLLIKQLKLKSCSLDPIPAFLFKEYANDLCPAVLRIINISLCTGEVSGELKHSIITPIYKKKDLDVNSLASYRPIAQLPLVAILLERHVANHLRHYLTENNLHNVFQSAYRRNHSCETAIVRIHSDIARALGDRRNKRRVLLVLLDLSAAFDTLDHRILLQRLSHLGLEGLALSWFTSYLSDRTTSVKINNKSSTPAPLRHGVPQGSTLGPILFNIYCTPLAKVIEKHCINFHMYADDTQLYIDFTPSNEASTHLTIQECVRDVKEWLSMNKLLLNEAKTEVIELSTLPSEEIKSVNVCGQVVNNRDHVRNLGVILDKTLTMAKQAKQICKNAYFHLHCIRKIRPYLTLDTCKVLVQSLVISRLDYCNAVLNNAHGDVIKQLERVQKSAARVIMKMYKQDKSSITDILYSLHWLPISARIEFKICVLMFNAFHYQSPPYLASLITHKSFPRSTRAAHQINCVTIPPSKDTRYSDKSFTIVGPKLWNNLENDLRAITSIDTFKKKLKTFLFKKYYNDDMP